jgi:hypothetical protein
LAAHLGGVQVGGDAVQLLLHVCLRSGCLLQLPLELLGVLLGRLDADAQVVRVRLEKLDALVLLGRRCSCGVLHGIQLRTAGNAGGGG